MSDLFLEPKSKKEQLLEFIKKKHYAKSHEVMRWGLENFYISADRVARTLAEEGRIRRVPDEEK
jgi:hypothetical protein